MEDGGEIKVGVVVGGSSMAGSRHERTFASIKARLAQGHEADAEMSEQTLSATLRLPDTRKSPCFGTSKNSKNF